MKPRFKNLTALALVAAVFGFATGEARGACTSCEKGALHAKSKKKGSSVGRGLASVGSSSARLGQGELMLHSVKTTSPRFMRPSGSASPVKIAGVCRDLYGMTYNSTEKGYESCLTSRAADTSSFNEYFGAAQRQAGVGILVGN